MRISDWSSDVCSSDLGPRDLHVLAGEQRLRSCHRRVLLGRRVGQRGVVVGPRLVVIVDRRQLGIGEDGGELLQPAAALQRESATAVEFPAALPLLLILVSPGVALAGPRLHIVEPDVLGAGAVGPRLLARDGARSEEHTSELQSLMRNSYAVFCLKK